MQLYICLKLRDLMEIKPFHPSVECYVSLFALNVHRSLNHLHWFLNTNANLITFRKQCKMYHCEWEKTEDAERKPPWNLERGKKKERKRRENNWELERKRSKKFKIQYSRHLNWNSGSRCWMYERDSVEWSNFIIMIGVDFTVKALIEFPMNINLKPKNNVFRMLYDKQFANLFST